MSKPLLYLPVVVLFALGCGEPDNGASEFAPFYLGTYTEGDSQGIYKYVLHKDGTLNKVGLMAETVNPSYLAFSPDDKYLLAVNEVNDSNETGYISSFRIGKDTLTFLDQKPSGGAHPCHVATNGEGYVVVANYTGGNMGLLKITQNGHLSRLLDVQQHEGKGLHPRQEGPHAHSGWFTADGSIISADLGTNQLWFSSIDRETNTFKPEEPKTISLEAGAGPRHLAFHPENPWVYVVNELSSSVSVLKENPESGVFERVETITTLPGAFTGENTCADIHVSPDGKFLYASNRGHNSIALFSIDSETGRLRVVGYEPTRGETPRNFSLSPDGSFLLVANQATNNIVSFRRNAETGLLTYIDEIEAPTPVCILFAP
ncbi:MAG: lactonase family protein [Robiginitalea sp.]|jgi:6-phosphogluconolactonase